MTFAPGVLIAYVMGCKFIFTVIAVLCLFANGYAKEVGNIKIREWNPPVLKTARTCLEIQVQDYKWGMNNEVQCHGEDSYPECKNSRNKELSFYLSRRQKFPWKNVG